MTSQVAGMIIDDRIRELVRRIDRAPARQADGPLRELVLRVKRNCAKPAVRARYAAYARARGVLEPYPLGEDGYAVAFDPLTDERAFMDRWLRSGVVVGKTLVPRRLCTAAIRRIHAIVRDLSGGRCDLARAETAAAMPRDPAGVPLLSRGFLEIYHDDSLAQLRQAVRIYLHHVLIWGRHDLWTSYDRYGVKLPGHPESYGLPLHVDQNPRIHPGFTTVQGILALTDCPAERGTTVVVPGSKLHFPRYRPMAAEHGEHVEIDRNAAVTPVLERHAQPIPLRQGDLVSWDSRTTHANTGNTSRQTRYVAIIAAGPAREDNPLALQARGEAFRTGLGSNVREALMHASKKPRYTDPAALARARKHEKLTLLGRLLYGQASYKTATPAA
jgi:hypothetical protein